MKHILTWLFLVLTLPLWAMQSSLGELKVTAVATGFDEPWSFAFMPSGGILVTERGGRLLRIEDGNAMPVSGLPDVDVAGQGGLFDVVLARNFISSRELYLSYNKPSSNGSGTAVARARLSNDGTRLEDLTEIFAMTPGRGGRHFGGRLVVAADDTIFLTLGDRGNAESAQDLSQHQGSIIRIDRNGHAPTSNPFVGYSNIQNTIWSYGHRNIQGAALDANGNLIAHEHGAMGGDEVNIIYPGANYGWPVIAYGRNYNGTKIGKGTANAGMMQPEHYWDPSIAPSGLAIYQGQMFPSWQGHLFIGSLKVDSIERLRPTPRGYNAVETLKSEETVRVRDIREGPDGAIWFLSVGKGALFRVFR